MLEVKDVYKRFGGLEALKGVSFCVNKGELIGLIGPNGAGKTTLFNVISGILKPEKGIIKFKGIDIVGLKPYEIARLGIGRTFQLSRPLMDMTLLDNVVVACIYGGRKRVGLKEARSIALEKLRLVGLADKAHLTPKSLTLLERKILEISRALALDPELLLLDEPLSGLSPREIDMHVSLIKRIREDLGVTVIWIEHVMRAIMGAVDRVIVLHQGAKIAEGSPREVAKDSNVIKAYLGEEYAKG